jgi:hypothetical protein
VKEFEPKNEIVEGSNYGTAVLFTAYTKPPFIATRFVKTLSTIDTCT